MVLPLRGKLLICICKFCCISSIVSLPNHITSVCDSTLFPTSEHSGIKSTMTFVPDHFLQGLVRFPLVNSPRSSFTQLVIKLAFKQTISVLRLARQPSKDSNDFVIISL